MFKFNGGRGALLCDCCRIILYERVSPSDEKEYLNSHGKIYCNNHKTILSRIKYKMASWWNGRHA